MNRITDDVLRSLENSLDGACIFIEGLEYHVVQCLVSNHGFDKDSITCEELETVYEYIEECECGCAKLVEDLCDNCTRNF